MTNKPLLVFSDDEKGTYLSLWSFAKRALTRLTGPRVIDPKAFFSPNDDFVAYTSQESGRPEVYVTTFPERRKTWPVTTDGGQLLSVRQEHGRHATLAARGTAAAFTLEGAGICYLGCQTQAGSLRKCRRPSYLSWDSQAHRTRN